MQLSQSSRFEDVFHGLSHVKVSAIGILQSCQCIPERWIKSVCSPRYRSLSSLSLSTPLLALSNPLLFLCFCCLWDPYSQWPNPYFSLWFIFLLISRLFSARLFNTKQQSNWYHPEFISLYAFPPVSIKFSISAHLHSC